MCYNYDTLEAGTTTFAIIDKKLYVPIVTLLNQDITRLFEQLNKTFKERLVR